MFMIIIIFFSLRMPLRLRPFTCVALNKSPSSDLKSIDIELVKLVRGNYFRATAKKYMYMYENI
jgi:hypothetical protein